MSSEAGGTGRFELELLQALSACGAEAETPTEAATQCAASLRRSPLELPFAAIYLLDDEQPRARLAMVTSPGVAPVLPMSIPVAAGDPWCFAAALERALPLVVRVAAAAANRGQDPAAAAQTAAIVGLVEPHGTERLGVLVAGLNPSRAFDADYSTWIRLVGVLVAGALARARERQRVRRHGAALAGGAAVDTVETLEHEDGVHHTLVSKFPIPAPPGPSLIGGIAIDVTQRVRFEAALRESEARFRSLADHAPVLIWVNGLEGCDFVNREYLRFLGCAWQDVRGLGWQRFVHPDDKAAYLAAYLRAFQARQPFDAQVRLHRSDGQYRWLHSTGVPRVTADGAFVGYVGCSNDITDLKRSEQSLLEADRHKDEFLATLAHELRNPLAPMRTALETLRLAGATQTPALAQAHGIMQRQLQQMVRLIDDLLDLGRIGRGTLELRKQRLTLSEVLASALETTKPTLDAAGRELVLELPEAEVHLEGDLMRLAQVFANLLHNAVKYTDAGGHIRLRASRAAGTLAVSVADNGVGISPEALPRVFDMFTQVDRGLGASRGGLGVGLSIVRSIVRLHGGSVEALSAGRGRGAEFVVRLPALAAPAASAPEPDAPPAPPPAGAPRRILVVDDNRDAAASLALLLEMKGNEVRTARDGREALGLAEQFRPELIFLDIGLPGLDGHGVCRRIREQPWGHALPIVALTGWSQEEDRRRSQQSGFTHHLVKPAEPALIDRLLASLPNQPPLR